MSDGLSFLPEQTTDFVIVFAGPVIAVLLPVVSILLAMAVMIFIIKRIQHK